MDNKIPQKILDAYSPESFKNKAEKVLELLVEYLRINTSGKGKTVLPNTAPEETYDLWDEIDSKGNSTGIEMLEKLLEQSQHIHHKRYIGHQVTPPLPDSAIDGMVTALLNNSTAVYEMSPVDTIMQKKVIEWMCKKIGYSLNSDGVLTSGGTLGNLTALLAARQVKGEKVWSKGVEGQKLAVLVSELSHYSIERAVGIMGMGTDAVFKLPVDDKSKIDNEKVQSVYDKALSEGYKVIALVANAGSTVTGCHDDFMFLADFCEKNDLWFHVDGAHGASALVSGKYKSLLEGIEKADSVVWDMHKMMLMPALVTGVLFKNGENTYKTFLQEASYLFKGDSYSEWYNYAHRTLECTKDMMGMRPYFALQIYGEEFFETYIDYVYTLTREFADTITSSNDFELAVEPESNIICFRYIGDENSDEGQKKIREQILESEQYYIVQTNYKGKVYLRCTIINPLTTIEDLSGLLEFVRRLA